MNRLKCISFVILSNIIIYLSLFQISGTVKLIHTILLQFDCTAGTSIILNATNLWYFTLIITPRPSNKNPGSATKSYPTDAHLCRFKYVMLFLSITHKESEVRILQLCFFFSLYGLCAIVSTSSNDNSQWITLNKTFIPSRLTVE